MFASRHVHTEGCIDTCIYVSAGDNEDAIVISKTLDSDRTRTWLALRLGRLGLGLGLGLMLVKSVFLRWKRKHEHTALMIRFSNI